jgi:uncharacterized protein YutE (UPF0331/DUF86 family)
LTHTDRAKLIPHVYYLEKELPFFSQYENEVDWKVYQTQRTKQLEIERWVESLIKATLDICKMLLMIMAEEVPETSRQVLFKIGVRIYEDEEKAELFSGFAKIRNTLAHRYLDLRWSDIKGFLDLGPKVYPSFLEFVKKELQKKE